MPAVSKDLQEERDKVKFNVDEFTTWFYGGREKVDKRRSLEKLFLSDPDLDLQLDMSYLGFKERYEEAVRRSTIVYRKVMQLIGDSDGDFVKLLNIFRVMRDCMVSCINKEGDPLMLQFSMFLFMMNNLTSDEQRAEWLPRVLNCRILGTYAQTELGHGTNVRGIETTATYDPKSREFIINTPQLSSYKFWPGNLGNTVNYAIVIAQLYTQEKCHGVHPFIVQIRDLETHKPLPGVTVGDIGDKSCYNSMNNGFLCFDHVRIPLNQMLMKTAKVHDDGTYEKNTTGVLNYGAMLTMRVSIVHDTWRLMSRAAAIAVRYSLVRRQSPINPHEPEPKIIEHTTQQQKVFVPLVRSIIFKLVAEHLDELFAQIHQESHAGNLMRLPELHALACCLKAVCTDEGTRDVEICRLACGGHGYLQSAGLDIIHRLVATGQIGEGMNTVMLLQTSRYLLKAFAGARSGDDLTVGVAYLSDFLRLNGRRPVFDDSVRGILSAVQTAAGGQIASTWRTIEERKKHWTAEEAANLSGIELVRAAELHCHACILQIAIEEIEKAIVAVSPALGEVLGKILEFYAVDTALRLSKEILLNVEMSIEDITKLQRRFENLLKFFRHTAIGIVDGFDYSDQMLDSTLGSYDGRVYERLLAATKKSTLNEEDVNRTFYLYLKPFMNSKL